VAHHFYDYIVRQFSEEAERLRLGLLGIEPLDQGSVNSPPASEARMAVSATPGAFVHRSGTATKPSAIVCLGFQAKRVGSGHTFAVGDKEVIHHGSRS
jgi:hypothetical protein